MPSGAVLVVYTSPAPAPSVNRAIGACPLFPDDNPWATDISGYPVHPRSDGYINYILAIGGNRNLHADFGSNPEYGIPYTIVPATQPTTPVVFEYAGESDPGLYPISVDVRIKAGSDRHALIVREGECRLYELFALMRTSVGWQADSGALFDLRSNALRPRGLTSADVAGLPTLPGLVRIDEVRAGAINHALRFTVSRTQRSFITPATHYVSSITDPNAPPMGLRLRADCDISRFPGQVRGVLEALRRYGMFVSDNGSNRYITGETEPGWDDSDMNQLKTVPGSAFEAVDNGPVVTSAR